MFLTIIHFFNVLTFLDITLAILCCMLLIRLPLKYAIKYVTIPLLLFVTYISLIYSEDLFGRPYEGMPIGKFEYRDYRVVISNNGEKKIELWIIQNKKSRLYLIPYFDMVDQQLSKANIQRRKGVPQQGEFKGKKIIGNKNSSILSIADVPIEEILPPKGE